MITARRVLLSILALGVFVSSTAWADDSSNLSARSIRKMARRGDPTASISAFSDVCRTVKSVIGNEFLWKSVISAHIPSGDARATGPTFICNKKCPPGFPMNFYYSDGRKAGAVGYYGTYSKTGKARAYCAAGGVRQCFISQISSRSRRRGRDGFVYVQLSGSRVTAANTVCYKVKPVGRTGSAG